MASVWQRQIASEKLVPEAVGSVGLRDGPALAVFLL